jgi:hypothetical protein
MKVSNELVDPSSGKASRWRPSSPVWPSQLVSLRPPTHKHPITQPQIAENDVYKLQNTLAIGAGHAPDYPAITGPKAR